MNTQRIRHIVVALSFAISLSASAAQYKMLSAAFDSSNAIAITNPTDVVEVTAFGRMSSGNLSLKFSSNETTTLRLDDDSQKGTIVSGVKSITANGTWVVLKITPAESTTPAQPSNVAVIPSDANGQYQVILESSVDMVTWN